MIDSVLIDWLTSYFLPYKLDSSRLDFQTSSVQVLRTRYIIEMSASLAPECNEVKE